MSKCFIKGNSHVLILLGPLTFQWEFLAYVNIDFFNWRATYNTKQWRNAIVHDMMGQPKPSRIEIGRR